MDTMKQLVGWLPGLRLPWWALSRSSWENVSLCERELGGSCQQSKRVYLTRSGHWRALGFWAVEALNLAISDLDFKVVLETGFAVHMPALQEVHALTTQLLTEADTAQEQFTIKAFYLLSLIEVQDFLDQTGQRFHILHGSLVHNFRLVYIRSSSSSKI